MVAAAAVVPVFPCIVHMSALYRDHYCIGYMEKTRRRCEGASVRYGEDKAVCTYLIPGMYGWLFFFFFYPPADGEK